MTIDGPVRTPLPRTAVLSFMAGLSHAAGFSMLLYVDELMSILPRMMNRGD